MFAAVGAEFSPPVKRTDVEILRESSQCQRPKTTMFTDGEIFITVSTEHADFTEEW